MWIFEPFVSRAMIIAVKVNFLGNLGRIMNESACSFLEQRENRRRAHASHSLCSLSSDMIVSLRACALSWYVHEAQRTGSHVTYLHPPGQPYTAKYSCGMGGPCGLP